MNKIITRRRKSDVPKDFDYNDFKRWVFEAALAEDTEIETYQRFWESCVIGVVLNVWVNQDKKPRTELADNLKELGKKSPHRSLYAHIKKKSDGQKAQRVFVADVLYFAEALKRTPTSLIDLVNYEVNQIIRERRLSGEPLPPYLQTR